MTFKELRKQSGMTQKAFADYFGIPRRTIEDWEREKRKCSPYLLDLMQYKLEKEGWIGQVIQDDSDELDRILARAHREARLKEMKQKLKDHEEWKKKHPRPKHKKEEESEDKS